MNGLVLDASVTLTWCYPDEHSAYAYRVLDLLEKVPASVPSLWPLEVANAVAIGERRQRLAPADVMRFLELLRELPIEIDAQTAARALSHTLPLARTHRLSAYDAAYLELAMREKLILTTLDNRLRKAAQGLGVAVLD